MSKQRNITVENNKFTWVVGKDHFVWIRPHKEDKNNPIKSPVKCDVGFYGDSGTLISITPSMVARWITENIFKKEWTGTEEPVIFINNTKHKMKFVVYKNTYEKIEDYYEVLTNSTVVGIVNSLEKANTIKNNYDKSNPYPEFVYVPFQDTIKICYVIKEENIEIE